MFTVAIPFFNCDALNVISLQSVSMKNQECDIRPWIINININEPVFYLYSITINSSCNNINDPYAKLCVTGFVKNTNIKLFNLMSRSNEARYIKCHETGKCKCRLDASICSNKQIWNKGKCRCECKELIDKRRCSKRFNWNPSNNEWELHKSCEIGEYLDYQHCTCKTQLLSKLVKGCSENIDGNEII